MLIVKIILREIIRMTMIGLKRGPHITRYYMYRRLSEFGKETSKSTNMNIKVLSISDSISLCRTIGLIDDQIVEANYPKFNMLNLPFPDDTFDYVISDQVLEHIEGNPQIAIKESFRVLKPGGLGIHTTCFINPIHSGPGDYWRFTPDALLLLCKRHSKIEEYGGWGNVYVWLIVWLGLRSEGIPEAKWHPFHKIAIINDERIPIVTWVIARKKDKDVWQ